MIRLPHLILLPLLFCSCYGDPDTITGGASEEDFAGIVIHYNPSPGQFVTQLNNAAAALLAPDSGVVCLGGFGGSITVKMNRPITDLPGKPDFVVWGNAMYISGNSRIRWAEPALIEVSPDNSTWYLIGGSLFNTTNKPSDNILTLSYSNTNSAFWPAQLSHTSNFTITNYCLNSAFLPRLRPADHSYTNGTGEATETLYGYGDCTPGSTVSENWSADDPFAFGIETSGGDPIMLEWAVDPDGNSIYSSISNLEFRYIRITTAVHYTAGFLGEVSTEIDAIGICR